MMQPPDAATASSNALPPLSEGGSQDISDFVPKIEGYQILSPLGQGGMGTVWRAVQLSTRREVAIKLMNLPLINGEKVVSRFQREVELTARLQHPHIARVYDSGVHHGLYFYAMELIEGVPLDQFVCDRKLSRRQILELMRAVVLAVQHAHQRGIIHRDLKPSNILISPDGQPHLLDFGLAKLAEAEQDQGISIDSDILGTPAFMSPEQAAGRLDQIDTRSDVYSLGATLFLLLIGQPAHDLSGSRMEVLNRISREDIHRPRSLDRNIGRELDALLLKALAKDPQQRYTSAGEFARDIENYLSEEPLIARPATTAYFLRKRLRKHWLPVSSGVVVLLVLLALAVFSFRRIALERGIARSEAAHARQSEQNAQAEAAHARRSEQNAQASVVTHDLTIGQDFLGKQKFIEARQTYLEAWDLIEANNLSMPAATDAISLGLLESYRCAAPPVLGADGRRPASGDLAPAWMGLAVSRDGRRAVCSTPGPDSGLTLWDLPTGTLIRQFGKHDKLFNAVALSPDDRMVLAGDEGGALTLWDLQTGSRVRDFIGAKSVRFVSFSPNGQRALSSGLHWDPPIRLWDVSSGKLLHLVPSQPDRGHSAQPVFSPDGRAILSGYAKGAIELRDSASEALLANLTGGQRQIMTVAFSPDGRRALSAGEDPTVRLWDLATAKEIRTFVGHQNRVDSIAFLPDGNRALSSSVDRTVRLWNLETGALVHTFAMHAGVITNVAPLPSGRLAISTADDQKLKLFGLGENDDVKVLKGHTGMVSCVAVARDGLTVLSSGPDGLRLWDCATGCMLWQAAVRGGINAIAICRDGKTALCAGEQLNLWNIGTGKIVRGFAGHAGSVFCLALSADGTRAVSGGADKTVRVWDLVTGHQLYQLNGHSDVVRHVAWRYTGELIMSAGDDNTILWWTGNPSRFRPATIPASDTKGLSYWRSEPGLFSTQWALSPPTDLKFSENSSLLITASHYEPVNLSVNSEIGQFCGDRLDANAAALDRQNRILVCGGEDHLLYCWDIQKVWVNSDAIFAGHQLSRAELTRTDPLCVMGGHEDAITSLAWSPVGNFFASASKDKTVRLWDLDRPGRYRELEPKVRKAREDLNKNSHDPSALLTFAQWHDFRNVPDWAADFYEQARVAGASFRSLDLARCYWKLGRHAESAREFRVALQDHEAPDDYLNLCLQAVTAAPTPTSTAIPPPPHRSTDNPSAEPMKELHIQFSRRLSLPPPLQCVATKVTKKQ